MNLSVRYLNTSIVNQGPGRARTKDRYWLDSGHQNQRSIQKHYHQCLAMFETCRSDLRIMSLRCQKCIENVVKATKVNRKIFTIVLTEGLLFCINLKIGLT